MIHTGIYIDNTGYDYHNLTKFGDMIMPATCNMGKLCYRSQLANMKKYIPHMSLPWNL